jgi:hypothetical protein
MVTITCNKCGADLTQQRDISAEIRAYYMWVWTFHLCADCLFKFGEEWFGIGKALKQAEELRINKLR